MLIHFIINYYNFDFDFHRSLVVKWRGRLCSQALSTYYNLTAYIHMLIRCSRTSTLYHCIGTFCISIMVNGCSSSKCGLLHKFIGITPVLDYNRYGNHPVQTSQLLNPNCQILVFADLFSVLFLQVMCIWHSNIYKIIFFIFLID